MTPAADPPATNFAPPLAAPVPRALCTDCGISRSTEPGRCGSACQFIRPDYPRLEREVHGRARDPTRTDEEFFGPFRRMLRASLATPLAGAQWTGIATRIGERLLATRVPRVPGDRLRAGAPSGCLDEHAGPQTVGLDEPCREARGEGALADHAVDVVA